MGFNITQTGNDMSGELTQLFIWILMVYMNTIVSLLGIIGNAVNIRVIAKQGFSDGINISLFVLAISDTGVLLTGLVSSLCQNPAFQNADLPIEPMDFMHVVGSFTRSTFSRITSCITAFITLGRCLCVALPLKARDIISNQVTAIVVGAIFVTLALTLVPFYLVFNLGWKWDSQRNRIVLGMVPSPYTGPADLNVVMTIHTFVQLVSYCCITIFSLILLFKLKLHSQWRQQLPGHSKTFSTGVTRKIKRTLILVTTMAVIYLICYAPSIAILLFPYAEEEFDMNGDLRNVFRTAMAFCLLFENINSSTTILLYYSMSANYRKVFLDIICVKFRRGPSRV